MTAPPRSGADFCAIYTPIRYSSLRDTPATVSQIIPLNMAHTAVCRGAP